MTPIATTLDASAPASLEEAYAWCKEYTMVGFTCTSVFGTKEHPQAREFAIDMGIALQIVNIMRDVAEDAERGRVYFPADELAQHGLTDADILARRYDDRFAALMRQQG